MSPRKRALDQIVLIEGYSCLYEKLPEVPRTSMPDDRLGAAGSPAHVFVGLGLVGVWAAIHAYLERTEKTYADGVKALAGTPEQAQRMGEIEDIRNLYAHNFAGLADDLYWRDTKGKPRHRWVFREGDRSSLPGGGHFDGELHTSIQDLRTYVQEARRIIEALELAL